VFASGAHWRQRQLALARGLLITKTDELRPQLRKLLLTAERSGSPSLRGVLSLLRTHSAHAHHHHDHRQWTREQQQHRQ